MSMLVDDSRLCLALDICGLLLRINFNCVSSSHHLFQFHSCISYSNTPKPIPSQTATINQQATSTSLTLSVFKERKRSKLVRKLAFS